jgi:Cap4 dsDNA endonuclease
MTDLLNTVPPDDTGSDTLRRYRYQGQLAVPFCLECAFGGSIRSVIMEHYEDIVVEYTDHWRFIQVKTRDGRYGPWKLGDAMDGLKSLYRTYQSVSHLNAKYSLFLEGAIAYGNALTKLEVGHHSLDNDLCTSIMRGLKIARTLCEAFLKLTIVQPNQPPREHIRNHNIRLLAATNSNVSQDELEAVEAKLTDEILRAMSQERLEIIIPAYIKDPNGFQEEQRIRVEEKRMTQTRLRSLLGSLVGGPFPLLQRIVDPNLAQATNLEKKLIAGGATKPIINQAKNLRANATIRETELAASELYNMQDRLDDVQCRSPLPHRWSKYRRSDRVPLPIDASQDR